MDFPKFIKEKESRERLAFVGGFITAIGTLIATIIGATWALYHPSTTSGITDDTLKRLEKPWQDLSEAQKQNIARLEKDLALNQQQILTMLRDIGQTNVQPDQIRAKLEEAAKRYKEMEARLAAQPGDNPAISGLKAKARTAFLNGQPDQADALLAQAEGLALSSTADIIGQRGDLSRARFRYREAAGHYARAAAILPAGKDRFGWQVKEANAYDMQGDEFGDKAALHTALDRWRSLLTETSRQTTPDDWAQVQNALGITLSRLGGRESGTDSLKAAVTAYKNALLEFQRDRVPLQWAGIQNNLGNALC